MRLLLIGLSAAALLTACATPATPPAPTPTAESQLIADLRILSADDMEGRDTGAPGGERARAYIIQRLEAIGVAAPPVGRLQPFTADGRTREGPRSFSGQNILGVIPGTRAGHRWIVVTAHYDHVGVNDGQVFNGADDNASGVATALALAERLKAEAPEHGVIFAFLDGEERGLLGARHFVDVPPVPLESIALNVNYDMTARADDGKLWVTGTYQHPTLRPILEPVAAVGNVSLSLGKDTPQDTGADNWVEASDHAVFFRAGLPFLYFGVDYHPDYHRPSDDFERVTPETFTNATELSINAFRALDRALGR